ncbi:MAG TPA: hypothetical protein VMV33_17225 [Rhodocyclaceae bacterium]|nr:hypothetical protein [Rhodocyclaceae bacterium]
MAVITTGSAPKALAGSRGGRKVAKLDAAKRKKLPSKDFALPGKGKGPEGKGSGSYPIPDKNHARAALSRVSANGTPAEKAEVKRKVKAKFPGIGADKKGAKAKR